MTILLVFWIMCAVASAMIASGKGRSGGAWFVGGLIFGFFALIVITCLPTLSADPQAMPKGRVSQLIAEGKLKRCSDCAEAVQPEAKLCRFCGHVFTDDEAPKKPSAWARLLYNPAYEKGRRG